MSERMVLGRDNGLGCVAWWEVLDGKLALVARCGHCVVSRVRGEDWSQFLTRWTGHHCEILFITVGDNSGTLYLASGQPLIIE